MAHLVSPEKRKSLPIKTELPDWFPLPVYEHDLSPDEWASHLTRRVLGKRSIDSDPDATNRKNSFRSLIVDEQVIDDEIGEYLGKTPRVAIDFLNAFESFYVFSLWSEVENKDAREFARMLAEGDISGLSSLSSRGELMDMMNTPSISYPLTGSNPNTAVNLGGRHLLSIDMSIDDETLIQTFKDFLVSNRDSTARSHHRRFGDAAFMRWKNAGILPAFDLTLWGDINGYRYTDVVMGNALWPDEQAKQRPADTTERYRKGTKPLMEAICNQHTVAKLWGQAKLHNFLMDIAEKEGLL